MVQYGIACIHNQSVRPVHEVNPLGLRAAKGTTIHMVQVVSESRPEVIGVRVEPEDHTDKGAWRRIKWRILEPGDCFDLLVMYEGDVGGPPVIVGAVEGQKEIAALPVIPPPSVQRIAWKISFVGLMVSIGCLLALMIRASTLRPRLFVAPTPDNMLFITASMAVGAVWGAMSVRMATMRSPEVRP